MRFLQVVIFCISFFALNTITYGQGNFFVKLVMKNEKKFIYLLERNGTKIRNIFSTEIDIKNYKAYDLLLKKIPKNEAELSFKKYLLVINQEEAAGNITTVEAYQLRFQAEINNPKAFEAMENDFNNKIRKKILNEMNESDNRVNSILRKAPPPTPLSLKNISKAKVFISIPSNEKEFKNIFQTPNNNQCKNAVRLRNLLVKENNKNVSFPMSQEVFFEMLSKNDEKEKRIIIIGHNDEGVILFPDGSSSKIHDIDSVAKQFSRLIIYLSCNASDYTTNPAANYFLTYPEAVRLTNRLDYNVTVPLKLTSEQLKNSLQKQLNDYGKEKQFKFKLKVTIYTGTASVVGYGIYKVRGEK